LSLRAAATHDVSLSGEFHRQTRRLHEKTDQQARSSARHGAGPERRHDHVGAPGRHRRRSHLARTGKGILQLQPKKAGFPRDRSRSRGPRPRIASPTTRFPRREPPVERIPAETALSAPRARSDPGFRLHTSGSCTPHRHVPEPHCSSPRRHGNGASVWCSREPPTARLMPSATSAAFTSRGVTGSCSPAFFRLQRPCPRPAPVVLGATPWSNW
jgi:hypothetical protein